MSLPISLPFGVRDLKVGPYATLAADELPTTLIDIPNVQNFSFTTSEEFTDLPGDDNPRVASHGQGATGEGSFEAGGWAPDVLVATAGGEVVASGTTPNRTLRYVFNPQIHVRPYFLLAGQSISDSGGDLHTILWLCRVTGDVEWEFAFGEFLVPSLDVTLYQARVDGELDGVQMFGRLYDFVQNETITALTAPELDA